MVKPSSFCEGCTVVVSWTKCTSCPCYMKISIYEHGGMRLLSPCWEQGEPLLYVLALPCVHPGCRRLETAMPECRGSREGQELEELESEQR